VSSDLINWSFIEKSDSIKSLIFTTQYELILSNGEVDISMNCVNWNVKREGFYDVGSCAYGN
jgi:hypothetical protein